MISGGELVGGSFESQASLAEGNAWVVVGFNKLSTTTGEVEAIAYCAKEGDAVKAAAPSASSKTLKASEIKALEVRLARTLHK